MDLLSGLIGAIVGSIILVFSSEIRKVFLRSKQDNPITGNWECTWYDYDSPLEIEEAKLTDCVVLKLLKSDKITGHGNNPDFGKFYIEGQNYRNSIILNYVGENNHKDLVGTILLKKAAQSNIMSGVWWQYSIHDEIIGGNVQFESKRIF